MGQTAFLLNFSVEKLDRLSMICGSHQISLRRFQTHLEEIPTG
jgi:hypothetical protein